MSYSATAAPVRVFLFKREFADVFHLRLAIGLALESCLVNVLDQNEAGLRTACVIVRSAALHPSVILFEQMHREPRSLDVLDRIREQAELRALPLVILGDGEDPACVLRAYQDGAQGFIPLPERPSELPRIGRDLAQFWWQCSLSKSA